MQFRKHCAFHHILLASLVLALVAGFAFPDLAHAADICVNTDGSNGCKTTLQEAVSVANDGDTINIAEGTYSLSGTLTVSKAVTISGAGQDKTIFQFSGGSSLLDLNASGIVLENIAFNKTDKTTQNIVNILKSNITVRGNLFHGQYVFGDPEASRAMVTTGGITGILIQGNTIYSLRQPAYLNPSSGVVAGTIQDNVVYGTRGWVVDRALYQFVNNSWGDGTHPNFLDIALLGPAEVANNYPAYYGDLIVLSQNNGSARIENQATTSAELTDVYVDAAVAKSGDGTVTSPYKTITPALTRVMVGGTIHVAAGDYLEAVSVTKAGVKLLGAGKAVTTITGPKTGGSNTLEFKANNILVDGFKITREGNTVEDWQTNVKSSGVSIFDVTGVVLQNCEVSGNRNGVYFNGFNTTNNTVKDCLITHNRTGVNIARGSTGNLFLNNEISNNFTFGVIFTPYTAPDTAVVSGFTFTKNRIFGNWYAQVMDRNNLDSLNPAVNMKENWFGAVYPSYSTENIVEPGYTAQIPELFGGTAKAPAYSGSIVDTDPDHSRIDYAPWCTNAQCETTAGRVIFLPVIEVK